MSDKPSAATLKVEEEVIYHKKKASGSSKVATYLRGLLNIHCHRNLKLHTGSQ
jgi:hypothetical protein